MSPRKVRIGFSTGGAVFPANLDEARLTYETPFGAAEVGKDEIDFTRLPSNSASQFYPQKYGGSHALDFRQAIDWIDASSPNYAGNGVMAASDTTVHLFRDPADAPVDYPVLQHVLLASRQSLAWNPQYWYTQKGTHRYHMTLLPHGG
jgi:alpha-mannosidase